MAIKVFNTLFSTLAKCTHFECHCLKSSNLRNTDFGIVSCKGGGGGASRVSRTLCDDFFKFRVIRDTIVTYISLKNCKPGHCALP